MVGDYLADSVKEFHVLGLVKDAKSARPNKGWTFDKWVVTMSRLWQKYNSGADEQQQKQSQETQPQIQYQPPTTGIIGVTSPATDYVVPISHVEVGHTMARTTYAYADPYYGNIITAYGGQAVIHPPLMGIHAGVPLPSDTVEEPVYVNAKQYHGILRRRQSRAKAESENKLVKCRKPYLHESRHLHALRRARGCGGRFLNAKVDENEQQNGTSTGGDKSKPGSGTESNESGQTETQNQETPSEQAA